MKKLLLLLLCILPVSGAWAPTNCAPDNCAILRRLQSSDCVNLITDAKFHPTQFTWTISLKSNLCGTDVMSGAGTCLASDYGLNTLESSSSITADIGQTDGRFCFCKMTHPVTGDWVYMSKYDETSDCVRHCVDECSYKIAYDPPFKSAVVNDVSGCN